MRTLVQEITEMLKQTNSRTPAGPTRARASGTNRLANESLGRSRHTLWGPTRRRATKDGSIACSLPYYIYVVPILYILKIILRKLVLKSLQAYNSSEFTY